ncbi:ferrochelatase [Lentibacter algarum]|uniref:ferrochelatase n=1 Tax=Lentibacter algarum TaxID=576131 RepID=UPI001C06FC7E|nr:ferrochelatase [Lentibacter algarum]MBU2981081.1 ferrochelatase [Lentibacter algarum]
MTQADRSVALRQLPKAHPELKKPKIGVLLANLGTPDDYSYWPMRRYLSEFLSDKRVIDYPAWKWQPLLQLVILSKRPFSSGAAYKSIWNNEANESPLMTITKEQTAAVSKLLEQEFSGEVVVDFCMRYGNPSTESKTAEMIARGCDKILFFPLYPQYAGATSGTANDEFFRALMKQTWQPSARTMPAYFGDERYIAALADSIETHVGAMKNKPETLVVSYHGMPERYLQQGDPYHCQCQKTTRLLRERLGWTDIDIITTFQSVFGPEEWLKPYTVKEVARLAAEEGKQNIAVVAPAFSADCIETLEEINEEIREAFEEAGGKEFSYIPCLNASTAHVQLIADLIKENLQGW